MEKLVIASNNSGKIKEFREILNGKFEVISMSEAGFFEDVKENGNSFFENALIKAKTVSENLKMNVLADDSGLCVSALNGAPGIYSARYAGEHGNSEKNNALLLKNLQNFEDRSAKFCSSIVLYKTNGEYISGYGECKGKILFKEEGFSGFGYDPLFYSLDLKKSFAVATDKEKNSVSHRYRAILDLLSKL